MAVQNCLTDLNKDTFNITGEVKITTTYDPNYTGNYLPTNPTFDEKFVFGPPSSPMDGSVTITSILPTDMKFDKGKINAALPYEYFPNAIKAIAEIATYGAKKYARGSWQTVADKEIRYRDAMHRHLLDYHIAQAKAGNVNDDESGLSHLAHAAWNMLAILEMEIRNNA